MQIIANVNCIFQIPFRIAIVKNNLPFPGMSQYFFSQKLSLVMISDHNSEVGRLQKFYCVECKITLAVL